MNEIISFLTYLMSTVPLEAFVFIGTCIDELISPIPAFLVLIPAGIAAHVQGLPWWYLSVLAVISGVARTVSGYILYIFANKLEHILFRKGRMFFGYSHQQVESYGKKLAQTSGLRSWLLLFSMHALPVFPGTLLSLGSGFIRLPLSIFASATIGGASVSAAFFLYLGYSGTDTAETLKHLDTSAQIITIVLILALLLWLAYRYIRTRRHS